MNEKIKIYTTITSLLTACIKNQPSCIQAVETRFLKQLMKETSVSSSLNVYGAMFNGKCESSSFGIKKHSETNFAVFLFLLKQFWNGNIAYSNGIQLVRHFLRKHHAPNMPI